MPTRIVGRWLIVLSFLLPQAGCSLFQMHITEHDDPFKAATPVTEPQRGRALHASAMPDAGIPKGAAQAHETAFVPGEQTTQTLAGATQTSAPPVLEAPPFERQAPAPTQTAAAPEVWYKPIVK
jgi:hypothetical protein